MNFLSAKKPANDGNPRGKLGRHPQKITSSFTPNPISPGDRSVIFLFLGAFIPGRRTQTLEKEKINITSSSEILYIRASRKVITSRMCVYRKSTSLQLHLSPRASLPLPFPFFTPESWNFSPGVFARYSVVRLRTVDNSVEKNSSSSL